MIFTSHIDENGLTITAHPENEAEWNGFRFEGPWPAIRLIHTEVKFEYPIKSIHPDLLALLCMLSFFPYCKDKITFPKPVSPAFVEAFSRPILTPHEKIDEVFKSVGGFEVQNVDKSIKKFHGSNISISFGGGIDSLAVHVLYPKAILIHELARDRQGRIHPDNSVSFVKELQEKRGKAFSIVNNIRRGINQPEGWSTWASSVANVVLMATDLDIGYIMTGTTGDTLFLANGKGFREVPSPGHEDPWNRAFSHLGLPLFSPVWCVTEAGTMKICHDAGVLSKSVSCQKNNGGECHKCFKCFRKYTLANALHFVKYNDKYWKRYKTRQIIRKIHSQPLYFAHIFKFAFHHLSHLDWLRVTVEHVADPSSFLLKYYEPGISLVPEELQEELRDRISRYLDPLIDDGPLKNWKQPIIPYVEIEASIFEKLIDLTRKITGIK